jgi:hypothetical protein
MCTSSSSACKPSCEQLSSFQLLAYLSFTFCSMVPALGDITIFSIQIYKNIWVDWRRTRTVFQIIWETVQYLWSWVTYLCSCVYLCVCSAEPSTAFSSCMGCLSWFQTEGFSGAASYCWDCLSSAANTSPTSLCESCWTSISSCIAGTGEWCGTLTSACTRGPTGFIEFCSASIASCGAPDSMLSRIAGCFSYCWTSFTGAFGYIAGSCASCWQQYGPWLYSGLVGIRDFIWSWLMWLWRQVRLFFT